LTIDFKNLKCQHNLDNSIRSGDCINYFRYLNIPDNLEKLTFIRIHLSTIDEYSELSKALDTCGSVELLGRCPICQAKENEIGTTLHGALASSFCPQIYLDKIILFKSTVEWDVYHKLIERHPLNKNLSIVFQESSITYIDIIKHILSRPFGQVTIIPYASLSQEP